MQEDNDGDKLNQCLSEITTLELDIETLKKQLKEHEENDPDKFYALKEQTVVSHLGSLAETSQSKL